MCGGSNKTTQNTTSTYTPTPQASAMYKDVMTRATDAANNTSYDPATNKTIADFTPQQTQAFGQVQANQGAWQPAMGQANTLIGSAGEDILGETTQKYMNPWQDAVVEAALAKIRDQDAMQNREFTAGQTAQGGLGGNGMFVGRAQLQADQGENRNATIANLMAQGFSQAQAAAQADKNRQLAAGQSMANLGQLTSQLGYADANANMQAGTSQQQQQQAINDAAAENASRENLWDMQEAQWLGSVASGIGPLTGGTTTSKGTAEQSQGKGIGNILGGAITLAGMASDERVKENKTPIGKTFDGQTIWKYNYKGDPRSQIGLMAQEVEGEHPEAVRELGGVKHVNYDEALSDSYADGGGVFGGMPTAMPWATINPAKPIVPDTPDIRPPAAEGEGQGQDFEQMFAMGKKAGAGLKDLWGNIAGGAVMPSASSPAGGALAASGLQGLGGGGGMSILSGLGSLFGFADGGGVYVPSDEEIAAIESVESGGREDVVSPKGARGPMQVMPDTGRDPGFGVQPLRDDSPAENRRFGRDYYAAMLNRYNGDAEAARIAYNGGPARADAWLKAGRDDSVIPAESANYYKKVSSRMGGASGTDGGGTSPLVAKGMTGSPESGERYKSSGDRATGGLLKRMFGVEFNPLNLNENERRSLIVAGLGMMSHGNIGRGGLQGMHYLAGAEAGDRDAAAAARKLQYEMQKDAQQQANWTQEQSLRRDQFSSDKEFKAAQAAQEVKKFDHTVGQDEKRLAFDEKKLGAELTKPTDDLKEYDAYAAQEVAAGRSPLPQLEYMTQLKRAGKPETNVNVSGDKKGAEEMSKRYAEKYFKIGENAEGAQQIIDNLDQVERSLNEGLKTGIFGEWEQTARKIGAALGVGNIDKVAAGELVQTISNRMALQVRAPGGDSGGMPGAMSDADRTFLKETVPGLLKTPEGNRKLINIMKAAAVRHQAIHDMAIDFAEENGGQLGPAFDRSVREYIKANPLSAAVQASEDQPRPVKTQTIRPRAQDAKGNVIEWTGKEWAPAP
jgi:hypothetical protein